MATQQEINRKQREDRKKNNNAWIKRYEKTKKGFLVRKYRNMKSRILGIQKKKAHLYEGKSLLDKELFYEWALSSKEFHAMFKVWEEAEYNRGLCPTVDRIDPNKGYILSNMRWLTHSDNSRYTSQFKAPHPTSSPCLSTSE